MFSGTVHSGMSASSLPRSRCPIGKPASGRKQRPGASKKHLGPEVKKWLTYASHATYNSPVLITGAHALDCHSCCSKHA